MQRSKPFEPNQQLVIGDRTYRWMPHPEFPHKIYGQKGAKGTTYQLQDTATGKFYALKELHPEYRTRWMVKATKRIKAYNDVPGLEACQRLCLTRGDFPELIRPYPQLEYAILMPWMSGILWSQVIETRLGLTPPDALALATKTAEILWGLEQRRIAHTDIAGNNLIIRFADLRLSLVDIEDLYAPDWPKPEHASKGTPGYQHSASQQTDQWCAEGDRFAGAVLIAEMVSWAEPAVWEKLPQNAQTVFQKGECQNMASEQFRQVISALARLSPEVAFLFDRAWRSSTLADCPNFAQWYSALRRVDRSTPRKRSTPPAVSAVETWRKPDLKLPKRDRF